MVKQKDEVIFQIVSFSIFLVSTTHCTLAKVETFLSVFLRPIYNCFKGEKWARHEEKEAQGVEKLLISRQEGRTQCTNFY